MFVINVLLLAWFLLSAIGNLRMYWLSVSFLAKYSIRKPLETLEWNMFDLINYPRLAFHQYEPPIT